MAHGASSINGHAGDMDVQIESQSVFLLSDLDDTPSVRSSGYSVQAERYERASAVTLILKVCDYLRLPIHVASAAAIYLHRFYMRFGLPPRSGVTQAERFPGPEVAATSVFLACKTEEVPRKLASIVEAIMASLDKSDEGREAFEHRDFARRFGKALVRSHGGHETHQFRMVIDEHDLRPGERLDEKTTIALRWRRKILHTEMRVAESAAFEFIHQHPHTFLVAAARKINMEPVLFDAAWWGLMDVLHDPILIILSPGSLAAGMYLHACQKLLRDPFPESEDKKGSEDDWRNTFSAPWEEVQEASQAMDDMYRIDASKINKVSADYKIKLPELYRKMLDRQAAIQAQQQAHLARVRAVRSPVRTSLPPTMHTGLPPGLPSVLPPGPPPGLPPALPSGPPPLATKHALDDERADEEETKRPRLDRGRAHALVSPPLTLNYGEPPPEKAQKAAQPPSEPNEKVLLSPSLPSVPPPPRVGSGPAPPTELRDRRRPSVGSDTHMRTSPASDAVRTSPRPDWGAPRASTAPSGRAFGESLAGPRGREHPPGPSGRGFGHAPRGPPATSTRYVDRPERPSWPRERESRDPRDGRYRRDEYGYSHDPGPHGGSWGRTRPRDRRDFSGRRDYDRAGGAPFGSAPSGRGDRYGSNGYASRNGYNQGGWQRR